MIAAAALLGDGRCSDGLDATLARLERKPAPEAADAG